MTAKYHTLALLFSIALAYFWLSIPFLKPFTFQIFALLVASFLIIKRYKKAKLWHILPEWASFEITLLTFAFLLLIGATDNTRSLFYPLGYIHLFFLVMTSHTKTAIVATIAIMLFHYALEPNLDITTVQAVITLPIMLVIFLFARKQYDEAHLAKLAEKYHQSLDKTSSKDPSIDPINKSTIASDSVTSTSTTA